MRNYPFSLYLFILIIFSFNLQPCEAQDIPSKEELLTHFGFIEESIEVNNERITFYTYGKGSPQKDKLVMYLQGSDPSPQFSYQIRKGKVIKLCWLQGEFTELSDDYLYVVVEKVGFEGLINEDEIPKPKVYQEKNSLGNRVFRANEVLKELCERHDFEKVIVYGHSEGAPVAAKLGTVNKDISHIGFWAGNALPDYYDFALEARKEYYKGNISAEESHDQIEGLLNSFAEEIVADTSNTEGKGYTHKRWWSYAEPPINNLLKLEVPLFVQVATNDESAPIESTYLIPLEFARLGKINLSYKVCVGCDHGFNSKDEAGNIQRNWKQIFRDFIAWTQTTSHE